LKSKFKVDRAQEKMIERMIEGETKTMREKLYEAFSSPYGGNPRLISADVIVKIGDMQF
jgi:hypothetical protein